MRTIAEPVDKSTKLPGWLKRTLLALGALLAMAFIIQTIVVVRGGSFVLDLKQESEGIAAGLPEEKADCILILGAALWDGVPCPMLEERLDTGADLYHAGASDTIVVSGAVEGDGYNEPQAMEDYLVERHDVPREAIVQDPHGSNTYASMYRARHDFGMDSAVVVTEKYHLFRACYIADALGVEVYGADACRQLYFGNVNREARECAARVKDFFMCIIQPELTYEDTAGGGSTHGHTT